MGMFAQADIYVTELSLFFTIHVIWVFLRYTQIPLIYSFFSQLNRQTILVYTLSLFNSVTYSETGNEDTFAVLLYFYLHVFFADLMLSLQLRSYLIVGCPTIW